MKKNNIKTIITLAILILSSVGLVVSIIWSLVFNIMHPDMTELRLFLENPYPSVIALLSAIGFVVCKALIEAD